MKNIVTRFVFWLFRHDLEQYIQGRLQEAQAELIAQSEKINVARRSEYNHAVMNSLIGKPVICFGNQNGNPIVGFCIRSTQITQAHVPVPVIANYVTLETALCLGKVFVFTRQRYEALLNMSGEQRWSLFGMDGTYNYFDLNVKFDEPEEKLLTRSEIDQVLEDNRFWALLQEYEDKQRQENPDDDPQTSIHASQRESISA